MPTRLETLLAQRFVHRVLHKAGFGTLLLLCALWALAQALLPSSPSASSTTPSARLQAGAWEWPAQWDGAALRPLAMSPVEQRFARQFPGSLARLTDERQVLVMRHVMAPTRMLHPAADCYRALGYRITDHQLEEDGQHRRWRCFIATREDGTPLRVCERITDAQGQAFTDTSAWYWAALRGQSRGPWLAVTTASVASTGPVAAPADAVRQAALATTP